jgi:serine/threonine protein kinase
VTQTGPIRWMSPESLDKLEYSEKSDVWSYGCLLHEIVYREQPVRYDLWQLLTLF